jgi:uncharacterized protein DUF929
MTDQTVGSGHSLERVEAGRQRRQLRFVGAAAAIIVLVLALLIGARLLLRNQSSTAQSVEEPVPPAVLQAVTQVPPSALQAVGMGTNKALPSALSGTAPSATTGRAQVLYYGAEWCPFCAGERWPMIIALSRFGTFSNLKITSSAADDVYPNTPTFSFFGSTYTSQYLDFGPVEVQANVRSGNGYLALQTPTPDQSQLVKTYDPTGGIPFIDFGNKFAINGITYDVTVLQGRTREDIAASLSNPNSEQAQAILGAANVVTATICVLTNNSPSSVCSESSLQAIEQQLPR